MLIKTSLVFNQMRIIDRVLLTFIKELAAVKSLVDLMEWPRVCREAGGILFSGYFEDYITDRDKKT